jgi:hypothetical protein
MADDYRTNPPAGAPPGIRNNNPGNITTGTGNWQGMTGNDGHFLIFADMSWGVRAIGISLTNMINKGYDTITTLISQWSATDQAAYIANVAAATSIDPGTQLGTDPDTIQSLIQAIVNQENGQYASYVTADDIAAGMSLISGNGLVTAVQSVAVQAVNDPTTAALYIGAAVVGFFVLRWVFKKK